MIEIICCNCTQYDMDEFCMNTFRIGKSPDAIELQSLKSILLLFHSIFSIVQSTTRKQRPHVPDTGHPEHLHSPSNGGHRATTNHAVPTGAYGRMG